MLQLSMLKVFFCTFFMQNSILVNELNFANQKFVTEHVFMTLEKFRHRKAEKFFKPN